MSVLDPEIFRRPSFEVSPLLIGKLLCVRTGDGVKRYRVTETEAYFGEEDTACHAHRGRTERNSPMYMEGGHVYVPWTRFWYLLNIVTGEEGHPESVLIRGAGGFDGPGRLAREISARREFGTAPVSEGSFVWFEDDGFSCSPIAGRRRGIPYASEDDRDRPWRFTMSADDRVRAGVPKDPSMDGYSKH